MKEIWFWISKDLVEFGMALVIILIAGVWFAGSYLIDKIKRRKKGKK